MGLRASNGTGLAAASVLNRAGAYVSPYVCPFPFAPAELPRSIASPKWNVLDLNATVRSDKYAIGGTIFLIAAQDLSTLGGASLPGARMHCIHTYIRTYACMRLLQLRRREQRLHSVCLCNRACHLAFCAFHLHLLTPASGAWG